VLFPSASHLGKEGRRKGRERRKKRKGEEREE
jgi:hypothetical protein